MSFDWIIVKMRDMLLWFNRRTFYKLIAKSEFHQNPHSSRLLVLLPGRRVSIKYNRAIKKKIHSLGYSLLGYQFHHDVISEDHDATVRHFRGMKETIRKNLSALNKRHSFSEIHLVGISTGCISALMASDNNPLVKRLTLVIPGHDLAEAAWNGIGIRDMVHKYASNGETLKSLKAKWAPITPTRHIKRLRCRQITVHLSQSDKVIPYHSGKKLVAELRKRKYNVKCVNHGILGHYLTAYLFYLSPKRFIR